MAQAAALRRFSPFFVGWRRVPGIHVPEQTSWSAADGTLRGKLRELRFRYLGPTRGELARLRSHAPLLVYAHFAPDGFAAMRLATRLGVPLVTALHGVDVTMNDRFMAKTRLGREYLRGRAKLQKEGALFIACSGFVRKRALALGFPAERTIVHSIGVDLHRFQPVATGRRGNLVLFVGRLVEKKGCCTLIEAMSEVQHRIADAELVIIGDGPLREIDEEYAAHLAVHSRFLGSQPENVVREWMARAAVFCVPSVVAASGDAEGLGMVFLEAQAMGLPVVSTRSGGISEAVKHRETGLLVGERAPHALAEAILALLQNEQLWQSYSKAGRLHVAKHFDLARQTGRLEETFEQLLHSRNEDPYPPGSSRRRREAVTQEPSTALRNGGLS